MAISACDTALWDLAARLLVVPLHRLLGSVRDDVPVYGSGGFTTETEEQLREQLLGWVGQGIRASSSRSASPGHGWPRDLDRVGLARRVVGPDVEVFVDANGGYDAATGGAGRPAARRAGCHVVRGACQLRQPRRSAPGTRERVTPT